ncbi:MAG: hypothetical protein IJS71_00680 [Clostridia bacterium]|nr:hypothetical protein [Clostridia bacterium]
MKFVKALAWLAETNLGKLVFGEILSGFIITPLSLLCDLLWGIAAFIIFNDSKFGKWVMSVIAFLVGVIISGIGAPEWCVIIISVVSIIIALFLQSHTNLLGKDKINKVK